MPPTPPRKNKTLFWSLLCHSAPRNRVCWRPFPPRRTASPLLSQGIYYSAQRGKLRLQPAVPDQASVGASLGASKKEGTPFLFSQRPHTLPNAAQNLPQNFHNTVRQYKFCVITKGGTRAARLPGPSNPGALTSAKMQKYPPYPNKESLSPF